jgi:HEPN domain-containing protein
MEAKKELVRVWLGKAQRDLASAQRLANDPDPYLDTAIYHCQQAAEKAIKGWLVFHDQRFEKTHDLRLLVTMAVPIDPRFSNWFDAAERLTPYATAFRYPDELLSPDTVEFN